MRYAPQRVDVAFLHVIACAINLPGPDVAIGVAIDFQPLGDVSSSGWWEPEASYAFRDLARENHDGWVCHVERSLRALARDSTEDSSLMADLTELRSKTLEQVKIGLAAGPFSRATLDACYGLGKWRPLTRFGVRQKGKLLPLAEAQNRTMARPHLKSLNVSVLIFLFAPP